MEVCRIVDIQTPSAATALYTSFLKNIIIVFSRKNVYLKVQGKVRIVYLGESNLQLSM